MQSKNVLLTCVLFLLVTEIRVIIVYYVTRVVSSLLRTNASLHTRCEAASV